PAGRLVTVVGESCMKVKNNSVTLFSNPIANASLVGSTDSQWTRGENRISCKFIDSFGVPYGNRTRVAAVKEKRFVGIQRKPAAWIARQGSQRYIQESLLDP